MNDKKRDPDSDDSSKDYGNHNFEQVRAWAVAFKLVLHQNKKIKCYQMEKKGEKNEKSAKISLFRLISSYFFSSRA